MNILIMGPAGIGKGTMSAKILESFKIPHISTGDMFRANIKEGTELGKKAQEYMNAGKLVPDEITVAMVADRLKQPDCQAGYLLDGYPRTLVQAKSFENLSKEIAKPVEVVINLVVELWPIASRAAACVRTAVRSIMSVITQVRWRAFVMSAVLRSFSALMIQRNSFVFVLTSMKRIPSRFLITTVKKDWSSTSMPRVRLTKCGMMSPRHWRT